MAGNTWDHIVVTGWKNDKLVHSSQHDTLAGALLHKTLLRKKHPSWELDHHYEDGK